MKVTDYKPDIYDNNLEMNVILNVEENEFENGLKKYIDEEFANTFIKVADENGIKRFETMMDINADTSTETLEQRRERVINRLIGQVPFTEEFLQSQLDNILGKNANNDFNPYNSNNSSWYYTINYNNYTLTVNATQPGKLWFVELKKMLERVVPCNIIWTVNIFQASWQAVRDNFDTWGDIDEMTWQQVLDGEWLS